MTMRLLRTTITAFFVVLFFLNDQAHAAGRANSHFKAVAFDYFVIFDPNSVVPEVEKAFPGRGLEFTKAWRSKQFEYSFLRSLTNDHEDFFKVTGDALDYTAEQMHLELTSETRARLLNAYLTLKPWPDAIVTLKKLRAAGLRIITIANFSPTMLRANAENAGIASLFDELVSTEVNGTFKPDPHAYELGTQRLHLRKDEIIFAAFGGWDAYGAKRFGYTTYWVNRFNLPADKLGTAADATSTNMQGLVDFVLARIPSNYLHRPLFGFPGKLPRASGSVLKRGRGRLKAPGASLAEKARAGGRLWRPPGRSCYNPKTCANILKPPENG